MEIDIVCALCRKPLIKAIGVLLDAPYVVALCPTCNIENKIMWSPTSEKKKLDDKFNEVIGQLFS